MNEIKSGVRNALEMLITEEGDFENIARYMVARPIRTIMGGGTNTREEKKTSAVDTLLAFCKNTDVSYPKGLQEKQEFLRKLDALEFDQKIEDGLSDISDNK